MALSFIGSISGQTSSGSAINTSSSLNVAAGDLLVACCRWESGASGGINVAEVDSSNSFTMGTEIKSSSYECYIAMGYKISAVADAAFTGRMTLVNSQVELNLVIYQFRPDSGEVVTKDTGPSGNTTSADPMATAAFTTTGNDEVVVAIIGSYSGTSFYSRTIGGVSADTNAINLSYSTSFYRILSATASNITAQANTGGSGNVAAALSFKSEITFQLIQEGFAFGDDNGNEASHTIGTQDANISTALDVIKTLRLLIDTPDNPTSITPKLKRSFNSGTYTDVPIVSSEKVKPVIEATDCTVSGNNTAQSSWAVSYPNASTGDLLIFYIAWDDSTNTTGCTAPAGPNSETLTEINATPITDTSATPHETRAKAWYTVATNSWTAGTLSFTPSDTESWSATVVRVPAGEFDSATPIGAIATAGATSNADTTVDSPAFSAGSTDGGGALLWFAGVDTDPLSATPPTDWTILQRQDLGAVAHGVAVRNAAVTDSESIASATWAIAGDSWTSIAVIVRAPTITYPVYIIASGNVTDGGEDTTARLSAPSGKTTSDFITGRRWDNENGTDSVSMGSNDYTEVEWILKVQSPAVNNDVFEFRVYNGNAVLNTYSVTPAWDIDTGGGTGIIPRIMHHLKMLRGN